MTTQTHPPMTVLESILEWSQDRSDWQRDALRRIVAKGNLEQNDIRELVELCRKEKGGAFSSLTPVPLEREHLPANPGEIGPVSLLSIADTKRVNRLAPNQTLKLAPDGLTVIYGHNGTGKSGYARILKRACRARHPATFIRTPMPIQQRTSPHRRLSRWTSTGLNPVLIGKTATGHIPSFLPLAS